LSEGDEEIVTVGDNTENASEKDDQKTELRRRPIREACSKKGTSEETGTH
jgi:hypothetical protein